MRWIIHHRSSSSWYDFSNCIFCGSSKRCADNFIRIAFKNLSGSSHCPTQRTQRSFHNKKKSSVVICMFQKSVDRITTRLVHSLEDDMFSKIVENATNLKNKITQEIGDRLVRYYSQKLMLIISCIIWSYLVSLAQIFTDHFLFKWIINRQYYFYLPLPSSNSNFDSNSYSFLHWIADIIWELWRTMGAFRKCGELSWLRCKIPITIIKKKTSL